MRTRADLVRFVESLPITPERREVVLLELEDHEKARRLQEPASNFLGAAMTASAAPFLFWIAAAGAGMPMGAMEGLLVRSVFGALAVTLSIGGLGGASFLLAGMRRR